MFGRLTVKRAVDGTAIRSGRKTMEKNGSNTKELIEQAAIKEFMKKGFMGASLRQIVKNAGVTTGAFYKYYPTKEKLFAGLVQEHADHVYGIYDEVLEGFEELPPLQQQSRMKSISHDGVDTIIEYVYQHYDNFKLLICKADGTPFADFIHQLVEKETAATYRFMDTMRGMGIDVPNIDPELCHMLASGMFSGIFEIVVHDMKKTEAKKKVERLKEFYTAGWERLLKMNF